MGVFSARIDFSGPQPPDVSRLRQAFGIARQVLVA